MSIPAGPGGRRQAVSGLQVKRRSTGEIRPAEVRIDEHLYLSEGGLERPQSTPLSTAPQWKGLGGVVIGAQPFGLVLDLPPDTHIR